MIKFRTKILIAAVFLGVFGGAPLGVGAATFVDYHITADLTWTLAGSPYVIDSLWLQVYPGATLTIEPGVIVKFGDSSYMHVYGKLNAVGTPENKIYFTSLRDDSIGGDTNGDGDATQPSAYNNWSVFMREGSGSHTIKNADAQYSNNPFWVHRSAADFENINIREALAAGIAGVESDVRIKNLRADIIGPAVSGFGGTFVLNDLDISSTNQNKVGLRFSTDAEVSISGTAVHDLINGIGLALFSSHATVTDSVFRGNGQGIKVDDAGGGSPASLSVGQSSISDNTDYGIYSSAITPVDARNNWWGAPSGPYHPSLNPSGFGDEVSDNVDFSGWFATDPLSTPACCSSVVFIPGLEASRLYRPGAIFENQLWEPNTNDDVRALALDPFTGESVNADIYTDDVIDEAFSVNIYKNFLSFMENMATVGDIADFETFPYDWRLDVKDVVSRAVALKNDSYEMIPRLRALAAASQTGKVTIIAHSNGGLVAKELLNALKDSGEENLVDRLILVATPELGTPKAAMEMLHGMEPFVFNFPREEVTRELAENMKSAYALLPSAEYFNQLGIGGRPIIEFSTTTAITLPFRGIYGETISSYGDLRKFILGDNGARLEPPAAAVNLPNVLKESFLAVAETRHGELDAWQPPAGVDVVRIIGWGLETPRGIVYKSARQNVCNADLSVCSVQEVLDPEPLSTAEGDGTVVYLSADALGGERYYVNMFDYNEQQATIDRDHKNILEIELLQDLISTLVRNEDTTTLPAFIFTEKPDKASVAERLRIDVHSPIALHLYDSLGQHTGPIPNPDLSSDLELFEEQIPNSYYWQLGEGQYAGAGGVATTTIKLVGTALGAATVGIERVIGDETIISDILFEDIPITAGGLATVEVVPNTELVMLLDVDGDGIIDAEITPTGLTPEDLIVILESLIKTLDLPDKKEKRLLKVIDRLEKELAKERKKEKAEKLKTEQAFKHLLKIIEQYQKKKVLSADEASELISVIGTLMSKVVK
ncbi:MAG: hypothetical protein A3D52_01245 [Candidatus Taylorbacteria bacterium RIFCSPHIGHO2_02_FULL_44_36]|uniref:Uncharacterized protein n=1 Tax=Candidatus Taylorbacteria bacterium RIFCSPLOWO2_12_FULL_44_15c TaxID=1802333 RepID=A0A1G2P5R3_9BACT|nr:MAG: hypothetical protein A3D52_01245 [Candidatus Taylorbacteria bacterium RIFCSPHIGHO2_02_FULL_44_36]OHA38885.1 MAG: hypothetical protein A3I97_01365 [Candidatus Taylorbacteria bacterium RIFCSPLOWO2_02_FULL_44_35]OHA43668.1 MAG: hypothetical protein A3G03_03410 [Candidatus Taylorbacteria bacterium RIFCSPLOWO2_12_FULL_44_15c]